MSPVVIDILKVGVTGFGFLLVFLGYQLMRDALKLTGPDLDKKLRACKFFLSISFVFFLVGAYFQFAHPPSDPFEVTLSVSPSSLAETEMPKVIHGAEPVILHQGLGKVSVQAASHIGFEVNGLTDQIAKLRALIIARASHTITAVEGGLDEPR